MASVRIDIREDDGSSAVTEMRTATPAQITAARELILDMTDDMTLPKAEPTA